MPDTLFYPRPEYPRPDRQRGTVEGFDWLNLNGPWQFRFDAERVGVEERWFEPGEGDWREQIIVPFCWESLAAWGEGDTAGNDNYYAARVFRNPLEVTRANHRSAARFEVGWYRRSVTIPDSQPWNDKRVILTIGAADFFTDCWCNGVHLGRHEGGYTPFEFDLTHALSPSKQAHLVLRVEDPMDNTEQPVGKQWRWYTTTSGIWQTVFVEPRSHAHIENFRVYPDIDRGLVRFEIQTRNTSQFSEVRLAIQPPGGPGQSLKLPVRGGVARAEAQLQTVALWDPNTPHLYDLTLELFCAGNATDVVRSYFGMRKIDFEVARGSEAPAALRVNNIARYLRGALYQSYFPDGVYTAGSVETIKCDIVQAKRFGFNFLRVHIKVDDPLLMYWADKLGILLMADFPNFGEGGDTPTGRQRFETMMRQAIARDFNHPSIFAWCLFNETWGFGGQTGALGRMLDMAPGAGPPPAVPPAVTEALKRAEGAKPGMIPPDVWVQQMWELAKNLDPTRLVEDMSVCLWDHLEYFQHCDTDINSWHFYIDDYQKAKAHIEKIVSSTFVGSSFNYVPGFLHKGQPLINSEYGGVGALDGDRDVSWSFKFLTNELRRHQQIAAYIYTELHDVEWEYNGVLNYDRTPKHFGYDPRIINESNTLPVDAPPVSRVALGSLVRVPVASSHYSTRPHAGVSLHWELAGIDTRGRLHQDLARGSVPIGFPHRKVAPAHCVEFHAPESTMLCTLLLSARASDGVVLARNFVHFFVADGYPPGREEIDRQLILRGAPGDWSACDWSLGAPDRETHRAEDCAYGQGHGFFEWRMPLAGADLSSARRIKVLCECSSRRSDFPQTDDDVFPTTLEVSLNGVPLYKGIIRDHPHDARGVLSYWRGGRGAYGYLVKGFAEGEVVQRVRSAVVEDMMVLRCSVSADSLARGGLAVYGAECGRFPVCPTIIIGW